MANISGINAASGTQPIHPSRPAKPPQASQPQAATDSVEISFQAQIASKMAATPDTRSDLVAQVKAQIADGTYETPEKLDAAIENLLNEL